MGEVGRPTSMTAETLAKLDEAFANGATDIQACFIANIHTATLYRYQEDHPEYCERKQALKDMIAYQAKIRVKTAIESEEKPETAKWYLERREKDFKNKQETDITTLGEKIEGFNFITKPVEDETNNLSDN